jgi:hypothetical protein
MPVRIRLRRDAAANWSAADPVLDSGEMGVETDTGKFKFGDGVTAWNSLMYAIDAGLPTATGRILLDWGRSVPPFCEYAGRICKGNGVYVTSGVFYDDYSAAAPLVPYSRDLYKWKTARLPASFIGGTLAAICYNPDNPHFVAVGTGGAAVIDAAWHDVNLQFKFKGSWAAGNLAAGNWKSVYYDGSQYVAVGDSVAASPDGIAWTAKTAPSIAVIEEICYSNGLYVAVGHDANNANGKIAVSEDLNEWAVVHSNSAGFFSVCANEGKFVAGTKDGVAVSSDGTDWADISFFENVAGYEPASSLFKSICFGNGAYLAMGVDEDYGVLYTPVTSSDGVNWSLLWEDGYDIGLPGGNAMWDGERFVCCSTNGVCTSPPKLPRTGDTGDIYRNIAGVTAIGDLGGMWAYVYVTAGGETKAGYNQYGYPTVGEEGASGFAWRIY